METVLVTGCAGFIGSRLSETLLLRGYNVIGIDRLSNYYNKNIKRNNLLKLYKFKTFQFKEWDLTYMAFIFPDLFRKLLKEKEVTYIFHLAAQAGVRSSWGDQFYHYTNDNILATQRLLEVCKEHPLKKFVFASTSSVYGNAKEYPVSVEITPLEPISPYGITKLTCEKLCKTYAIAHKIPLVILRYFTVYGPGQRPDMAFYKFIKNILQDKPIEVYGDGSQKRDFTYVDDAVEGTIRAATSNEVGTFNIGGGKVVELSEVIKKIEKGMGKIAKLIYLPAQMGDVYYTSADITPTHNKLGYDAQFSLQQGLDNQISWMRGLKL